MGGAPPPPLDAAPQGPKNRKNSALLGPDFGGMQGPRITSREGGGGGSRPLPNPAPRGPVAPGPTGKPDLESGQVPGLDQVDTSWRRVRVSLTLSISTVSVSGGFAQGRRAKRNFFGE